MSGCRHYRRPREPRRPKRARRDKGDVAVDTAGLQAILVTGCAQQHILHYLLKECIDQPPHHHIGVSLRRRRLRSAQAAHVAQRLAWPATEFVTDAMPEGVSNYVLPLAGSGRQDGAKAVEVERIRHVVQGRQTDMQTAFPPLAECLTGRGGSAQHAGAWLDGVSCLLRRCRIIPKIGRNIALGGGNQKKMVSCSVVPVKTSRMQCVIGLSYAMPA